MLSARMRLLAAVLASSAVTYVAAGARVGTADAAPEAARDASRDAARPAAAARGGGEEAPRLTVDEKELRTSYANAYRIHTTAEEVVLDFGFNMPDPTPAAEGKPAEGARMVFTVSSRTIMSYPNAKRLANSLAALVQQYERQFGEIDTAPKKPN